MEFLVKSTRNRIDAILLAKMAINYYRNYETRNLFIIATTFAYIDHVTHDYELVQKMRSDLSENEQQFIEQQKLPFQF
jgi:hypothetical protein